jgi:hypothetical protein
MRMMLLRLFMIAVLDSLPNHIKVNNGGIEWKEEELWADWLDAVRHCVLSLIAAVYY